MVDTAIGMVDCRYVSKLMAQPYPEGCSWDNGENPNSSMAIATSKLAEPITRADGNLLSIGRISRDFCCRVVMRFFPIEGISA